MLHVPLDTGTLDCSVANNTRQMYKFVLTKVTN